MADSMDWFCGENSTDFDNFQWELSSTVYNSCFVDLVNACIHAFFLVITSVLLLVLGCCTALRLHSSKTIMALPGHDLRWLVFSALWIVLLASVGEGVLTDLTRNAGATQPHLYVPQSVGFVALHLAIVYYHHMECWQVPSMSWILVFYWTLTLFGESLRLVDMINEGLDVTILRFDIVLLSLLLYSILFIIELNVIRSKVFGWCYVEPGTPRDLKNRTMYYYHHYVTLPSRVLFWWMGWLFTKGYKTHLEMSDLGNLPEEHSTSYHYELFRSAYEKEKERASKKNQVPSVWRTYWGAYGRVVGMAGILKFIGDTCGFISPLAVGGVVAYASDLYYGPSPDAPTFDEPYITVTEYFQNGFVLVFVMFLASAIRYLALQNHYYIVIIESIHMKTAIQSFVYEKSLHLSSWTMSSGEMTMGQITNHMSTDPHNVLWFIQFCHYLWSIPYQLIVILILLYVQLGYAALIGSAVFLITTPIQFRIGAAMSKVQKTVLKYADERLKKSNELLLGIKLLKLYGWEERFCSAIEKVRGDEVKCMFKNGMYQVATMFLTQSTPVMVTLVSFSLYSVVEKEPLTPEIAFSALALFNQMTIPLFLVPMVIGWTVNAMVSTKRLKTFFAAPEIEDNDDGRPEFKQGTREDFMGDMDEAFLRDRERMVASAQALPDQHMDSDSDVPDVETKDTTKLLGSGRQSSSGSYGATEDRTVGVSTPPLPSLPKEIAIKIVDGNFTWDVGSTTPIVSGLNLDVPAGKLTMVVGLVGSGKSSLLSAILGEMSTISGSVHFNRGHNSVSYGAQKAWLQNASLRDNILLGEPFDPQRYQNVIKACALQPDIDILPAGDMTEIGEKGINLSGGQKQRVSVARTIYSKADIVILDDPLSALDVHVGRQLFHDGIMDLLIDQQRTTLLVTHQLQYLQYADKVLVMDGGKISLEGNLKDIAAEDPDMYAQWQEKIQLISDSEESEDELDEDVLMKERLQLKKQISVHDRDFDGKEQDKEGGQLIQKEERERGSVSWRVYLTYAKAVKIPAVLLVLFVATVQMAALTATNFWLSEWSEAGANYTNTTSSDQIRSDLQYYIGGYAGLAVSSIVLGLIAGTITVIFALLAARRIHVRLLHNIVHAPVRFYDTTPIGRILNRFSSDTLTIDQRLWQTVNSLIRSTLQILTAIVVNTIVVPVFIVIVIPIAIGYYFLQKYFITTSRELQRLDSISKSPIFAHFSESLGGLSTIRAYRTERQFRKRIVDTINFNNIAYIYLQTANRWLGIRLDSVGALMVLIAGLACMVSAALGGLSPSMVGLALTYSLQMAGYLNWMVRNSADTEMNMNAVERIDHYSGIPTEQYKGIYTPQLEWPENGDIQIDHVSARYDADLEPVLRDITIHFKPGEKVGICGRTGSGKSSLMLALFRMIDTYQGRILIDTLDISHVPLITLRSRIAIIPQDPVLFSGTIRFNLDPAGEKSDDELWESLDIAQLKPVVKELEGTLDATVSEGGENFSVGQRQLFCLARAFLRKTRILVMDEATASIDMHTDAILQGVVATAFADKTVLTIAHRVSTIQDSDTILVLSDGRVVEYDTPRNLLKREDSMFSSLVKGAKNN